MSDHRHINIPIFVPHKGCPHTCVFCDQRRISGENTSQSPQRVKKLLEDSLITLHGQSEVEIAFFGGSFTGIPESEMVAYLEVARPYIESQKVRGIRLSTRPDTLSPHVLDILERYGVTAIELGVQSMDDAVLALSERGHTVQDVVKACSLIRDRGIKLGIQTMIGLPGDSLEKSLETARRVIGLKPEMVRIYPVLVLKGTVLETHYLEGRYRPLELEEAVKWCAALLPLYEREDITILRLGLHSSELLEASVVAGPYHPAFGELVESRVFKKRIIEELKDMQLEPGDNVLIRTRPDLVSKIIGQKRSNLEALQKEFNLSGIKVLGDLDKGAFLVSKCSKP